MFSKFLADKTARNMYITGMAGTGKTTSLAEQISYCQTNEVSFIVLAFTHKACSVLASKLPEGSPIVTLHSFLKKRPGVNVHATKRQHVQTSTKMGALEEAPSILFIDEFSMIGEKDYLDLVELQDSFNCKIVYIGDPYQLPPVQDSPAIVPSGKYVQRLVDIKRTDNPAIQSTLVNLVAYIKGEPPQPIASSDNLLRAVDIVSHYIANPDEDKVMLAYTNQRVQELNAKIAGRLSPVLNDTLYSPTTRETFILEANALPKNVFQIETVNGPLELGSKYKTLEHLIRMKKCSFLQDRNTGLTYAYIFGHANYNNMLASLQETAANSNLVIEKTHASKAADWARDNDCTALAAQRAKAWRDYLTFKDCVICLDFPYAMTVHKSQGSTYAHVYIDMEDISKSRAPMYFTLTYVAISRASKFVYLNT